MSGQRRVAGSVHGHEIFQPTHHFVVRDDTCEPLDDCHTRILLSRTIVLSIAPGFITLPPWQAAGGGCEAPPGGDNEAQDPAFITSLFLRPAFFVRMRQHG